MGQKIIPFGSNLTAEFAVIMARLNAEIKLIKGRTVEGLMEASIHIRRETEDVSPVTPVDKGNLRQSYFAVASNGKKVNDPVGSGRFKGPDASEMKADHSALIGESKGIASASKDPLVIMGYSANYAAPVHEMVGKQFHRRDKVAGPKWFETAVYRNRDKIVRIVADNAKIKP